MFKFTGLPVVPKAGRWRWPTKMAHPLFGTIFFTTDRDAYRVFADNRHGRHCNIPVESGINCRMATRNSRLAEFNQGPPPPGEPLQLLCEDHNGTYVLPFHCESLNGVWHNSKGLVPGQAIHAKVVGWRLPPY